MAGGLEKRGCGTDCEEGKGRKKVKDHRRVTILTTLYKMYAPGLAKSLRDEVEGKGLFHRIKRGSERGWEQKTIFTS